MVNVASAGQRTTTTTFARLVGQVRVIVQAMEGSQQRVVEAVADALKPFLDEPDLLLPSQRNADPNTYRQHILHVEGDGSFSIVALVWLPGQATPIHDHVSWCVVGVYEGQELETRYQRKQGPADMLEYLVEDGQSINRTSSVAALIPPGDIHCVMNDGQGLAISLHVYGADIGKLGSSIRRRYDLEIRPPGFAPNGERSGTSRSASTSITANDKR